MWPASQSGTPEHYQHHLSDSTKNDPQVVRSGGRSVGGGGAAVAVAAALARAAVAAVGVVVAAVVFKHAKSAAAHLCDFVRATRTTRFSARRQSTKCRLLWGMHGFVLTVQIYRLSQTPLQSLYNPYQLSI